MKPLQFSILVGAVFAGCVFGSWIALRPQPVEAQVRVEEFLHIPNGGLRMQNSDGRIIGVLGEMNGSGAFTLLGPDGQSSVQIVGGGAGNVILGSDANGSGLIVNGGNGEVVRVVTQGGNGLISAGGAKSRVEISGGTMNAITVPGTDGSPLIDIRATSDGGMLKLNGGGKTLIEMIASAGKGRVNVNGDGPAGVRLDGSGLLDVLQGGKTVFSAPVKADGLRPSPLAL